MREQFIEATTRQGAKKLAPSWTEYLLKVCGGYHAFESAADYARARWPEPKTKQRKPRKAAYL